MFLRTICGCQVLQKFVKKNSVTTYLNLVHFSTGKPVNAMNQEGRFSERLTMLPYDSRYPPTALDFWEAEKGAWPEYDPKKDPDAQGEFGGDYGINEPGYELEGKFVFVKEMVPQYVVPNLKECELQPYVPYNVKDVTQPPLTPEDLFDSCYKDYAERNAREIIENNEEYKTFGELANRLLEETN